MSLDIPTTGGYLSIDQTTTEENPLTNSLWLTKPTITIDGGDDSKMYIEADIDKSKVDLEVIRYLISGRLGFTGCTYPNSFLLWEDGNYLLWETTDKIPIF